MIGQTVSHYRIIELLGEGAMGRVYLAQHMTLGRQVAIKFLSSTSPEYRDRFLREARAVSVLTHPNIANVFDYGETPEGVPYIVMELIKGQTLSEKLLGGSLPLIEAVRIVSSIAAALAEAHHRGVVHRDVKPSNIVITERGQAKVLDFGLVKQIADESLVVDTTPTIPGSMTRSDVIVGTPLYLSPEQALGKPVDGRSDLFALGAVLYECLAGQSAFGGSNVVEIGAQVIYFTPPLPSKINPRVPPALDRITMKALEKKVEARYQKAEDLIADLNAVLPSLNEDDVRVNGRNTANLVAPQTHSASALRTLTDALRQPRLSYGRFIIVFLVLATIGFAVWQITKPAPYQPNALASDWYNKGTDALRNGSFLQASKAFQQAIAADPKFALAHARLAESWFELDYADRAKDEMLLVRQLAPNQSQLAKTDSLKLDAIDLTVTRNFPASIDAYQQLLKLTPDEPHLYVDLGRAFEKNDEVKKAIESYINATTRAPQYAPAFLRLGVLYGDQLDLASAIANFDKAQALFEASGNYEGQAEVAFQRGALLDKLGKTEEARPQLIRALELSRTTSNQYLEVKTLLKLGNVAVTEGDLDKGRGLMNEAINTARNNSIDNQIKRGLVDLGNSYFDSSDYAEAEKYFHQSLDLARQQKDNRNAARALLSLGSVLMSQSKTDEALRFIEQALPFYEQGGYRKEAMQALTLLARGKSRKGELEAALQAFTQQLKIARQLGDPSLTLPPIGEIGLLQMYQGKFSESLKQFEESYTLAKSLGNPKNIGLALVNRATLLWQLGRYDEARRVLDEARPIAEPPTAAKNLSSAFFLEAGRMALSQNNWQEAKNNSKQALELAGTQLKVTATEAFFTLGLADVFSKNGAAGIASCRNALAIANETSNPTVQADALVALAQALNEGADAEETLKIATEAQTVTARLGQRHQEWLTWLIISRADRRLSNNSAAQEAAARASTLLASLEQEWGSDNYNSYLHRPDMEYYRRQLSEALAQKP